MNIRKAIFVVLFVCLYGLCVAQPKLIDQYATEKTELFYHNLCKSANEGIMFGHQDDLSYGIDWWAGKGNSDVKKVVDDYPAIFGWDLGGIHGERNLDSVSYNDMRSWIIDVYSMGGINTVSWHTYHPLNVISSWETEGEVYDILPGGKAHEAYKNQLNQVASFFESCKSGNTYVPIIFRPFHEHNGDWFWWGKGNCTEKEYIALWRFTIDYLKNEKKLHHLIYAFSPDRSRLDLDKGIETYLYGYPGDDYVDIIGLDNYWDLGHGANTMSREQQKKDFKKSIELIDLIAKQKNKISALTETGNDRQSITEWYTNSLLEPIKNNEFSTLSYLLVWRNADMDHFYVPYVGHKNQYDFKEFYNDDRMFFLEDLGNIYIEKSGN